MKGLSSGATVIALVLLPGPACAQSIALKGLTGPAIQIGAAELKVMPHQSVAGVESGHAVTFSGVPLTLLAARAGAPQGQALHGAAMTQAILVTASDGYRVVLTLPDFDPAFRDEKVIVADSADGAPLDAHDGPFRLVVEGDKRPARWARGVTALAVVSIP